MQEFLPVGSVVLLKNATRPVVILGFTTKEEESDEIWDYIGCAYPYGVIGSDKNLLFQRGEIEKVLFKGYSDEEGNQYLRLIEESMRQLNS